jgi:hypothetical protein
MKARTALAWTAHRFRLTVTAGLATVFACVALSACTSGSTPSGSVTVFPPSASGATATSTASASATSTASATATSSATPTETATATPTATVTATPTDTVTASPSPSPTYSSPYPTSAPITGGGGTAGFQDAGIAVLGGAAIVAGFGSIAYRRRMTRRPRNRKH